MEIIIKTEEILSSTFQETSKKQNEKELEERKDKWKMLINWR